jgi:MoxR-like ATPase
MIERRYILNSTSTVFESVDSVISALGGAYYITDRSLATVLYLSKHLEKPLLLEGEPGVGKTEVALVLSRLLESPLIRLQCYEGLDAASSLYEWNYPKQLLHIRMCEQMEVEDDKLESEIYSAPFLIRRPLLEAITGVNGSTPVLLIDEIDRADEEFEAFLLEILSDFQVTIPEIGTFAAVRKPHVIITSNRTRDVHDALKRRCLYHWIDYPSFEKEYAVVLARVPGIEASFAARITCFMQRLRNLDLLKKPGISETVDWASALITLHRPNLDEESVRETLGCILKYREDLNMFSGEIWNDPEKRASFFEPSYDGEACAGR